MKRLFYILLCISALLSCEKKDRGEDIDISGHTIFKVDMEQITLSESNPYDRVWQEGDMIGVYGSQKGKNVGFYLKEMSEGESVAEFYGPVVKGELIRAYFPYEEYLEADINNLPFDLAPVQIYDSQLRSQQQFIKYANRAFALLDEKNELHFSYPYGMLEVNIDLDEPVNMTGATLRATVPISGDFALDKAFNIITSDLSLYEIALDFAGNVVSSEDGGDHAVLRFVLPPALYFHGELQLEIDVDEGQDMTVLLGELVINRVDASDFTVTSVTVGVSGIPDLEIENGYLEE